LSTRFSPYDGTELILPPSDQQRTSLHQQRAGPSLDTGRAVPNVPRAGNVLVNNHIRGTNAATTDGPVEWRTDGLKLDASK